MVRLDALVRVVPLVTVLHALAGVPMPVAAQVAPGQYVVARDGHFYLGDQRIRFWGVNATPHAYLDCKPHLDMFARRVAALGFNAVRAHYFLNPSYVYGADLSKREFVPYAKGDGSVWDGLDYLISRYKQLGVYCYGTEVLGPLPLTPEAYGILGRRHGRAVAGRGSPTRPPGRRQPPTVGPGLLR